MGDERGDRGTERYMEQLRSSVRTPAGFQVAVGRIAFAATEQGGAKQHMNMALVHAPTAPTSYAALTTTNSVVSPSVAFLRHRSGRGGVQTVLVNNKISNVGSRTGTENFARIQGRLGECLGVKRESVVPISTGVIGVGLPLPEMMRELTPLTKRLGQDSLVDFAQAIMTTDRFVKARSVACDGGTLVGVCKGAGMVEPNLNTMLVFFFTDISFSDRELSRMLRVAVAESFGRISIDGDQSTSDIVMIQSSRMRPTTGRRAFTHRLTELATQLALDTVRNGEGVGHIVEVVVKRARSTAEAHALARFVLGSRLVATAIAGNDANVGRLIARVGQYFGTVARRRIPVRQIHIYVESHIVFERGHFVMTPSLERLITDRLVSKGWATNAEGYPVPKPPVEICIDLEAGRCSGMVYGGDLTAEYVHINADYRS